MPVNDTTTNQGYQKPNIANQLSDDVGRLRTALDSIDTDMASKASNTHIHGNITNAGAIGATANLPVITTAGGVLTTGSFGTSANTFCQGNDARLSDTRTPTDGSVTNAKVASNAAIAGTKISPDFGSQNIATTGNVNIDSGTFYVDATNNRVGVGTSSPGGTLDVAAGNTSNCAIIANNSYSTGDQNFLQFKASSTIIGDFNRPNGTNDVEFNAGFGAIAFGTGTAGTATEKVRIDSSGRLLVGTSTATNNTRIDQKIASVSTGGNYGGASLTSYAGTNGSVRPVLDFQRSRGTTDGSFTAVASDDFLGTLVWRGSDGAQWLDGAYISALIDGGVSSNDLPTRLVFSTTADGASSPTERMRIRNTGQVWINQTSNISTIGNNVLLQVTGNGADYAAAFANSNASPYGIYIQYGTDVNNTTNSFLLAQGVTTTRIDLRSNGGIANYSANNVNLSDRNAKKDIAPAAGTWNCLKDWEIVNFRYKDQPDDADLNMGVIAQQVAESCPEVITVFEHAKKAKEAVLDKNGNVLEPAQEAQPEKLGVKDQQMMWMAIKALQEAMERIETLEAKVAALESV